GTRLDAHLATEQPQAFLDAEETEGLIRNPVLVCFLQIESPTPIADTNDDLLLLFCEFHRRAVYAGVLDDVEQKLTHDLEEQDAHVFVRYDAWLRRMYGHLQTVHAVPLRHEPVQYLDDSLPFQHRRTQLHRQVPRQFNRIAQPAFCL